MITPHLNAISPKLYVLGIGVFAVSMSALAWALPVPTDFIQTVSANEYRASFTGLMFLSALTLGAAILLLALKGFKTGFKRSYYLICAGLLTFSSLAVIYPASQLLTVWDISLPRLIGALTFLVGAVLIYAGVRRFARLLQAQNHWSSIPVFILVCGLVGLGAALLPVTKTDLAPSMIRLLHALGAMEGVSYFAVASIAWTIRLNASAAYSKALWWLWWTIVPLALTHVAFLAADYVASGLLGQLSVVLYAISHIPLILMSYEFYRLSRFDSLPEQSDATLIDIIVYTGSLASSRRDIDPILEQLRNVTARHQPGQPLTPGDTQALTQTYLQLEAYLTTKEPLRSITQAELRTSLLERFGTLKFLSL